MELNVDLNNVKITKFEQIESGEYNATIFKFTFSEEYNENLVKKAIFSKDGKDYSIIIENNSCGIPPEVLEDSGNCQIGVYAYETDDNKKLRLRYSPVPTNFLIEKGSFIANTETTKEITPSEYEQYLQKLNDGINSINAVIKETEKLEKNVSQSEKERKTTEETRAKDEEERKKAEVERNTAESKRNKNEIERKTAETTRKKNESDRIINENGRVESENIRNNSEETRKTNESERIANENKRILAEESREKITTEAVNNIKNLNEEYQVLVNEKTKELTDIADGVKNMATAIQLPQFYVDSKMKAHVVTATKLSNIDLYIKNGKLMEGVRTIE